MAPVRVRVQPELGWLMWPLHLRTMTTAAAGGSESNEGDQTA